MGNGTIVACFSSFSLGMMIIFDRLMIADCYRNKPDQAWLVSASSGFLLGTLATGATWLLYTAFSLTTLADLFNSMVDLFYPYGIVMVVCGALCVQVTCHYFRLFIPQEGGKINETAIAMWLATTPIWIFLALVMIHLLDLDFWLLGKPEDVNLTKEFAIVVTLSVGSLIWFESGDMKQSTPLLVSLKRNTEIFKMLSAIVAYTVILSSILRNEEVMTTKEVLALQPCFWAGFIAGVRVLLKKENRVDFCHNWGRMKKFLIPTIVAEIIGMTVYYFEFFALSKADPTLVNLITGAQVVLVFIFIAVLAKVRQHMEQNNIHRLWCLGLRLTSKKLPETNITPRKLLWFVVTLLSLSCATLLAV